MTITPETAVVWARLPMGNLTGMRISLQASEPDHTTCVTHSHRSSHRSSHPLTRVATMQLQGVGVAPFSTNKQNLFMTAIFEPLAALCSISTAELTQVILCPTPGGRSV